MLQLLTLIIAFLAGAPEPEAAHQHHATSTYQETTHG